MKTIVEELKEKLKSGEKVGFTYTKRNGETRHAYGTKNLDVVKDIDENAVPSGTGTPKDGVISYFDLDKNAWRSFREDSLVSIDN